ncbi:DUF2561 family protein [Mycolicibacterium sp.]|uniref:DUF2561 family protein n=1 Tax=Mycolicibacterium sp. TaxID=2320850 RepID=UPI0037CB7AE6
MTGPLESLDGTDRILLGACAAVWLAALGAGVAAAVALVDLGRGHVQNTDSADTPWLLYTIIGISVVVIAAAVPLLLRARAQADSRQPASGVLRPSQQPLPPRRPLGGPGAGAPVVVSGYGRDGNSATAKVEQVWLRYTLAVACAMGIATAATGIATYLMATDSDVAAWCLYGLAGVVTAGMVALPIVALRQLDAVTA